MNKPEKHNAKEKGLSDFWRGYRLGYNGACDDWEAFLPGEKEVLTILMRRYKKDINKKAFEHMQLFMEKHFLPDLAGALSKRIK